MAIGFTTDVRQTNGSTVSAGTTITGGPFVPDKGFSRASEPVMFKVQFGDGYEQRLANGINNIKESFSVSFNQRAKAEIDDFQAFLVAMKGQHKFQYTFEDSNAGGSETTIKVVADTWDQTWDYGDFYSLNFTVRRVYEA